MGQERQAITPLEAFDVGPALATCGRVVRAARKAQGLTQAELGALIGTVDSSIAALENGYQFLRTALLLHLFKRLGLRASVALPDDPDDPRIRLQQRVASASPAVQEMVRTLLDLLENAPRSSA